jgi:hypothetical protein
MAKVELDCVPYLGYAVSLDFSRRPELYKQVKDETARQLTDMQSLYGYAPNFPNDDIRLRMIRPIFGTSDGHMNGKDRSSFSVTTMPVFAAAAGFAENAQPTAFPMHRERNRSAIVPLRRFMEDLEGVSLDQTEIRTGSIFNTAGSILKDPGVSGVFGINAIDPSWPLNSTDTEGAKLIEKITTQLPDMACGVISRDKFVRMQRIAEKGFHSIFLILETNIEDDNDKLDDLIAQLYAWGSDLGLIGGAHPQR